VTLYQREILYKALCEKGLLTASEASSLGVDRKTLERLTCSGEIERVARGVYSLVGGLSDTFQTWAIVAKKMPKAVICLLSALSYHGLTTELPGKVWIALPAKSRVSNLDYPEVEVVYLKEPRKFGVQVVTIDKVPVSITSVPRTVAECFKFRNKVGIDVAVAALKEYWHERRGTIGELMEAAKYCRVKTVMQSYVEAVMI
jgi:predicted transcriptional regulator of viral defense system